MRMGEACALGGDTEEGRAPPRDDEVRMRRRQHALQLGRSLRQIPFDGPAAVDKGGKPRRRLGEKSPDALSRIARVDDAARQIRLTAGRCVAFFQAAQDESPYRGDAPLFQPAATSTENENRIDMKHLRAAMAAIFLCIAFAYFGNADVLANPSPGVLPHAPILLAHRGIAQRFDATNVKNDTCTATRILPPTHSLLENTIASMRASFAAGADVVEFDVHPTTDGQFAVFHDWTLDCRTNGHGVTREHAMPELRQLDIGYGYTADGGKTFPFRGKGVGLMPSLDDVFRTFPDRSFLINVKSNDPEEGRKLADALGRLTPARRGQLMVYGGDRPIATLHSLLPDMRTMSRGSLKACLFRYFAYGWSGIVPDDCRHLVVFVPINVASWLWGWPDRFLTRMASAGSAVFVIGPYRGGEFSTGIDTRQELALLPPHFAGGVLTNDIEMVGQVLKPGKKP